MDNYNHYDILIASIAFSDGTGSKRRPALVIAYSDEIIRTYRITSQYANKSPFIRSKYFEIRDWQEAGLVKPSWIDTVQLYDLDTSSIQVRLIGQLSIEDQRRFEQFLSNTPL